MVYNFFSVNHILTVRASVCVVVVWIVEGSTRLNTYTCSHYQLPLRFNALPPPWLHSVRVRCSRSLMHFGFWCLPTSVFLASNNSYAPKKFYIYTASVCFGLKIFNCIDAPNYSKFHCLHLPFAMNSRWRAILFSVEHQFLLYFCYYMQAEFVLFLN